MSLEALNRTLPADPSLKYVVVAYPGTDEEQAVYATTTYDDALRWADSGHYSRNFLDVMRRDASGDLTTEL